MKGHSPNYNTEIIGYKNFFTPTESSHGGCSIYLNKNLIGNQRKDLDNSLYFSKKLESTFVEIINKKHKNIIVGCIYKHPSMDIDEFNILFECLMEKISKENKELYLIGDFNLDLLKIDDENEIEDFYNIISSNLLVPHITIPTRITQISKTLIDNIFSNNLDFARIKSGNITITISDHMPQFIIIPKNIKRVSNKHLMFKRDTKHIDKVNFIADVINIDWDAVLEMNKCDPNYSFNNFDKKINDILDVHVPIRKLSKKELKGLSKPWITVGIRQSIKRRDKILNKYINCKDNSRKIELHSEYKTLRNRIVSLIKVSKNEYYRNFFAENAKDIRKTWKGIKSIININNSNKVQPSSMIIETEINSNPVSIANGFNEYFSSIANDLQQNINSVGCNFTDYMKNPSENSFFLEPTDSEEIIFIIDSINVGKASGPHSIPVDILKMIKCNIGTPLMKIINMSFETGIYPNNLKIAKVIPIYKNKGDSLHFKNYRPISLLSNINKFFEKLVYKRLYTFLNKYNCIYELQFGFRAKHSTNHALINLTEMIRESLDAGKFACGIFIDLQKAFDTVDHEILLYKLGHYGIRGIANKWFRSYLTDRNQFTYINGSNSHYNNMNYGVPQGSVLGPLLFLIYINDLHKAIHFSVVHHFADDTNLLVSNYSIKRLQKQINLDLKTLSKWLRANKISLNASKTELLIFRHQNKKINFDLNIKINGKKITPSLYVKYLGVYIDCHLNWKNHVSEVSTKLSRACGMLAKIRHYVCHQTLITIYYGIFSSIMLYGSQIWGQANQTRQIIKIIQNKALRVINFEHPRSSTDTLYRNCKIVKFEDNIKLSNFLFAYDTYTNNLPTSLCNKLLLVKNNHSYCTRSIQHKSFIIPSVRTTVYGRNSIKFNSVQIWNSLNKKFYLWKLFDQKRKFCKEFIKNHFLESY